jgi:predicted enzyme related to lactoylglutathione lyase
MSSNPVAAIMIHAPDWQVGIDWYERAFPDASRHQVAGDDFEYLVVDGVALEVVRSDSKVSSGAAGTVAYWYTDNLESRIEFLIALGATLFRGPMDIGNGQSMCQVKDPFGNPIGIRTHG